MQWTSSIQKCAVAAAVRRFLYFSSEFLNEKLFEIILAMYIRLNLIDTQVVIYLL